MAFEKPLEFGCDRVGKQYPVPGEQAAMRPNTRETEEGYRLWEGQATHKRG